MSLEHTLFGDKNHCFSRTSSPDLYMHVAFCTLISNTDTDTLACSKNLIRLILQLNSIQSSMVRETHTYLHSIIIDYWLLIN
jgi:hypothetical protein